MRPILFVFLLFITGAALSAQSNRKPAKVIDFGELYSTYSWDDDSAELRANLGDALADAVMAASNESAWPAGIASLTTRTENRVKMASYTVYYLTTIKSAIAILVAPATENLGMPADMQAGKDIYFVIGLNAIDLNGSAPNPVKTAAPLTIVEGNFASQMNQVTTDFQNGFVNLTGAQVAEDEEGMMVMYESRMSLEGSLDVYFIEDLLSASTLFHAEFPASTDPAVSLSSYQKLVALVQALKLSCCTLQKQQETMEGSKYGQVFTAYDPAGKLNIAYQGMVIHIYIEQGETFDKNGLAVSNWIPVLDIYEQ